MALEAAGALAALEKAAMVDIQHQPAAWRQLEADLAQHLGVGRAVEVAKALPQADRRVEAVRQFVQAAYVVLKVCDSLAWLAPSCRQRRRIGIHPGDTV